ncbi:CxC2 domain-containing protein [Mycena sanguinolenta]|uniref:CxC2 domain-containing protein n=1 Tax=Mycena sanguinolenta TaxID=230812 RepID=A0A8H6ZHS8_9AGAR|nr:CxC2 domain-containing protein [Mycena sanguinolenta]
MKRSFNAGPHNPIPKKRPKNVYSLQDFGHSLRASGISAAPRARSGNLSADGRRADVALIALKPPALQQSSASLHNNNNDWLDLHDYSDLTAGVSTQRLRKRKWYATTDDALAHWVHNYRDPYLRILITCDGTMGQDGVCSCGKTSKYRCIECFGGEMVCRGCIVERHRLQPLCRIERWNGSFFDKRELRDLGLRVQLGHRDNTPCSRAHPGRDKFVVIAPNGFHHVAVDFCECRINGSQSHWEQLLVYGWYPSTPDAPRSAVTISVLKLFHAVSLQGKTTAYHFFNALAKITDNTGSKAFKRRYQLILRVVHQWRNLRSLKRGGMGNDPDRRTSETKCGELGVECIACPKVGVNLPEKWEQTPAAKRFLYAVFLAIDACFSSQAQEDLELYTEFVKGLGDQSEMSTCTGLAALDHANTKYAQGYAATGCGMVTCGPHEVVCKNGVGDLQKGEKYGNMDYIVASAWMHLRALLFFLLSYDIMCQWSKNLKERLLLLPPALRFLLAQYFVKFVIPKLHILGHLRLCQENYSLLFTWGSAQADMEGIERIWSSSGLMGASTREMGPGSRQDTLDDFWHHWNWGKVVGMGETLRKRFLKARKELERQTAGLEAFIHGQGAEVSAWKQAVDDFEVRDEREEGDPVENPYKLPQSGPTVCDIELELLREEHEKERTLAIPRDASEETMTEYLMLGLEIEGQQRQLVADILVKKSPTTKELTDFRKYSPGALQTLAMSEDPSDPPEAERIPLFLPSVLSTAQRLPPLAVPGLAAAEARVARRSMRNTRHQHQNMRSRGLLDSHQHKIDVATATYRHARRARIALEDVAGISEWCSLEAADVRMLEDEEEAKRRRQRAMKGKQKEAAQENEYGERGVGGGVLGQEMYEGVRVEWCKAYARVKRWQEEVLLLQEEMSRCLRTLEWQAGTWDKKADTAYYCGKLVYTGTHLDGAKAFAARQAAVRRVLAARFRRLWWGLTNRIEPQPEPASSASSEAEEEDDAGALGDEDDANGSSEEQNDEGEPERAPPVSREEMAMRRAEMDELLAIQSTALDDYDDA